MDLTIDQLRFEHICEMLLQMSNGNFMHRIERTIEDDKLEILTVLVNMLAEEMNELIAHKGYVNPHHTNKYLIQTTIIIDTECIIKRFTVEVPITLGYTAEELYNQHFKMVLTKDTYKMWNDILKELLEQPNYHTTLQLTYITKKQLCIPTTCIISRLFRSTDILITTVTNVIEETGLPTNLVTPKDRIKAKSVFRLADVKLIQGVYDYVLNNLDKPLPTIKELARIFGTNEYKLKTGFKYLFKTSIYQFYNSKRLRKAHLLIQQTSIQLKEIALMSGFSTYPNFSKAFKKLFGYTPNNIKRKM